MGMMIEAVIWDFGGVLTESPFDNFRRYEIENGLPTDFLRGVNATDPDTNAWARFERAEIDIDTFDQAFAEESAVAGLRVPGADVIKLLAVDIRPAMVEALRRIAERLPTACITNNVNAGQGSGMARSPERAAAVAEVMTLFRLVVESRKIGLRKPDPRIYRMACDQLGVAPEAAIYLDDLGVNLKPARAMGMTTLKVTDPDATISALEELLALTLR
jgi:putative hydrolase of the HAD superfamily